VLTSIRYIDLKNEVYRNLATFLYAVLFIRALVQYKRIRIFRSICLAQKFQLYILVNKPRSNLVKDENGDLLADSHNILNRWKNYFSQLLNVHRVSDVHSLMELSPS
jgi:hypothetical protein